MKIKKYIQPHFETYHTVPEQICTLSQTGADGMDPSSGSDDDFYDDEDDVGVKEREDNENNPYGLW